MAKILRRFLALGIAAMLLFAFAACNGNNPPETDPEITQEINLESDTIDAAATEDEEITEETTTEAPEETTAEEATTGVPKTKEEIVAYYNAAVAKVKADKPGYTMHDRTIIDRNKISSSSGLISGAVRVVMPIVERSFTKWSDPSVRAKGADHSKFPPLVDIKPEWIKSATCTESGNTYQIKLYLVDEKVPVLPESTQNTIHGKAIDRGVYDKGAIMDGVEDIGMIDINKFACVYTGSYINATVNKDTGAIVKVTTFANCNVDVEAKVTLLGTLDASLPLGNETEYFDFGK